MPVTVRLFAALREAAGTSQIEVQPDTLPRVIAGLCERFGQPFATRVQVASGLLNEQPVRLDHDIAVPDGAQLALLPPFSGGSGVAASERRVNRVLLVGSLLVPVLLGAGVYAGRWSFGLVVVVIGVGSLIDLHLALAASGNRTVLPAAVLLAVGPVLMLLLAPQLALRWMSPMLAAGVIVTFLLAVVSRRRHETTSIVGSTLLAGLLVAFGTAALLLLHDSISAPRLAGLLALIALTDLATVLASRSAPRPRMRYLTPAAIVVAVPAAVLLYIVLDRPGSILPAVGVAVAAVVAAILAARLRHVLRRPDADLRPVPALLIGTADAVLLSMPLAVLWLRFLAH